MVAQVPAPGFKRYIQNSMDLRLGLLRKHHSSQSDGWDPSSGVAYLSHLAIETDLIV
jgi:hypothetical protein